MKKKSIALAAAVLLALSACSSEQSAAPPEDQESAAPPEDQEGENAQALPANKSFSYTAQYSDDEESTDWQVTLTETRCGLKSIADGEANPDWDGGDDVPQMVPAKPDQGNDFCILYWTWENVGKTHGTPDFSGDLMIGDERHARDGEDEMMSWEVMETELGVNYTDAVNPGESTESLDIYQVPEGVTPDAVWFPGDTMVSPSWLLVSTS